MKKSVNKYNLRVKSPLGRKLLNIELSTQLEDELDKLLHDCKKKLKNVNENLIIKAFFATYSAHQNHIRASGEAAYFHNIAVAKAVLNEIHLDDISVAVALLHDVPSRGEGFTTLDIEKEFGSVIGGIVVKLFRIKTLEASRTINTTHLENFRKLLVSLATDVRIILVKLAIRLHSMRTLEYLPLEKQKEISHETMEIYVPFANRFGLGNVKWRLEDLSFKYINRAAYDDIKKRINSKRPEREDYVKNFESPVLRKLKNDLFINSNNIGFELSGRVKHIYSIFNKMIARGKPLEELYDLIAIRVVLDTTDPISCFYAYGLITSVYKPVPETFKDYISAPKKNGYRSLHFAVVGPQNKVVEVQVRTREMHLISEEGIAAHINYKRGFLPAESVFDELHVRTWMESIKSLFEDRNQMDDKQIINTLKKNLFLEEIHVFTPNNELKTMPIDSTALDFAFEIHSALGTHCIGAKVNGRSVPLSYKLQSGDQIEIMSSPKQHPEPDWLNLVITPKAKSNINKYLKSLRTKKREQGYAIWLENIERENLKIKDSDFSNMRKAFGYRNKRFFFIDLAEGKITASRALDFLKYKLDFTDSAHNINSESASSKSIIVSGHDSKEIMGNIITAVATLDDLLILSVNYEPIANHFESKITFTITGAYSFGTLSKQLYRIEGVSSVRKLV